MSGYIYTENMLNETYFTSPLLGPHLGPESDQAIDRNISKTYHKSKLLCCKHRADPHIGGKRFYKYTNSDEYNEDCIYAIGRDFEATSEMKFSDSVHQMYRSYLFRDIAGYIKTIVEPHFNGRFECLSFSWTPTFHEAISSLESHHDTPSLIPAAIIMNMGLHDPSFYTSRHDIPRLVDTTSKLNDRFGTKFVMHSPTAVNETIIAGRHNIHNNVSEFQMSLTVESIPTWHALKGHYLDVYNLTKKLHSIFASNGRSCSRDGIHIRWVHRFMIPWKLNFLSFLFLCYVVMYWFSSYEYLFSDMNVIIELWWLNGTSIGS